MGPRGDEPERVSLLVRNLPLDVRQEDVRDMFQRYGEVRDIYLPKDYYTGKPRGFGFVEFRDNRDAEDALYALDRTVVGGREVSVVMSKESRKTPRDMIKREETSSRGPPTRGYDSRRGGSDRGYDRDRDRGGSERDRDRGGYDRDRDRGRSSRRDRSRSRDRRSRHRSGSRSASRERQRSRSPARERSPARGDDQPRRRRSGSPLDPQPGHDAQAPLAYDDVAVDVRQQDDAIVYDADQ
ncbi:hypothetical protein QJQ45_021493 [Haematococcus lacustris]|nr:hypothetical protein QJQ45_021493 [Haematococcus lacustris]